MKTVVITGSTSGIGYGLADSFLASDCSVVISGRSEKNLDRAVTQLVKNHGPERVFGFRCDVTDFNQGL